MNSPSNLLNLILIQVNHQVTPSSFDVTCYKLRQDKALERSPSNGL